MAGTAAVWRTGQRYKQEWSARNPLLLGEGRQFCVTRRINGKGLLMQTATILRRIEKLPALSRAGKRINGLHRLMRSRCLYERAYDRVSRNRGAMTPGMDGQTFDGMTLARLDRLVKSGADGRDSPRPMRRCSIPLGTGTRTPLRTPSTAPTK